MGKYLGKDCDFNFIIPYEKFNCYFVKIKYCIISFTIFIFISNVNYFMNNHKI